MSALTNLLPVTAAPVARSSVVKAAPNTVDELDNGNAASKATLDKKAAEAAQRGDDEHEKANAFADVYEEELQEQSQSAPVDRSRSPTAATTLLPAETVLEVDAQSTESLLADSGNPLPLKGEPLPLSVPGDNPPENTLLKNATHDARLLATSAISIQSDVVTDDRLIGTTPITLPSGGQSQTETAAIGFVNAAAGESPASGPALMGPPPATSHPAEQAPVSGTSVGTGMMDAAERSSDSAQQSADAKTMATAAMAADSKSSIALGIESSKSQSVAIDAMIPIDANATATSDLLAVSESSRAANQAQDNANTMVSEQGEEVLREQLTAKIAETARSSVAPISVQAQDTVWQSQVADRVRAWRGLSGTDSTTNLTTQSTGQAIERGRHELSMTGTLSGQIQQFAESLRIAVNNPSPTAAMDTAGASSSSTAGSVDASGAWRGDSAASSIPHSAGRAARATGLTFQQTFNQNMQASSFGQPLGQSFGEKGWAESLSQRVTLMAGQKAGSARIELDPPELGAMTVKITVTGDQASVNFTSANAMVRDALEQTFPRLQDLLGQQGLQLADANVSDNSARGRDSGESGKGAGQQGTAQEGDIDKGTKSVNVKAPLGLIDYYA